MLRRVTSYPPPPDQPSYGYGQPAAPDNSQAVWALVIAVVSVFLAFCCGVFSIAGGIAAIILARSERTRAQQWGGAYANTSMATAAFWLGVAAIAVGVVAVLVSIFLTLLEPALPT